MDKKDVSVQRTLSLLEILSYSTASLEQIEFESSPVAKPTESPDKKQKKEMAFQDRYNVKQIICKGGQANVHKAYDNKSCKDVAIKVYSKSKL